MIDQLGFLTSLDLVSLLLLFWHTTLFELPRYVIGALVIAAAAPFARTSQTPEADLSLSVVLVGHNEAAHLRRCIVAIAEQTVMRDRSRVQIVVVDDGSVDGMAGVARELQRAGSVDAVLRLETRGGKSAGVNLALGICTGDVIIISDIDTSFDRDAFAAILPYFADPRVGAVSGNLGVRNVGASLVTRSQAIEYAIGIGLGRRIADALGVLSIVSGAFGAFRRAALESVGRQDVEVGEDADLTMKLRRAGWRIRFAPQARGLTGVPETVSALISQRLRWDRGLITIWYRKFGGALDPRGAAFRITEAFALADVVFFQIVMPLTFPAYLIWLWLRLGDLAGIVLGATLIGYVALDVLAFTAAAAVGADRPLRLVPYLPLHTVLQITVMRSVRLAAIVQELLFRSSYRDPYVPARVMRQAEKI